MEFIKRLFNGNINPSVAVSVKGSQYEKLANESVNVQNTLSMIVSEENYSAGFRDGVCMMIDVFTGKNHNLKEL